MRGNTSTGEVLNDSSRDPEHISQRGLFRQRMRPFAVLMHQNYCDSRRGFPLRFLLDSMAAHSQRNATSGSALVARRAGM
jgi:hypothetical protein